MFLCLGKGLGAMAVWAINRLKGEECKMEKVVGWLGAWMVALSFSVSVSAQTQGPRELVEQVTADILVVVKEQRYLLDENPEAFYQAVDEVLSPIVAFNFIAKGVMGKYAKQATPAQKQRFKDVFQINLISTYAKGMAVYGDQEVVVEPLNGEIGARRKVSIIQKVRGADGENTVSYTMGKSKGSDEWKLLNVTINGINLGKTFRSQFAQAMKKKGDLDSVIDGWSNNS
jgi:phospholipid transport system substrate-binding protein